MTTLSDELLTGFLGPAGPGPRYNVDASERADVRAKLQNHLVHIQAAFAEGIAVGPRSAGSRGRSPGYSDAAGARSVTPHASA